MLLAYLDEIGEPGAFIAKDHPRFNTSPAFGYAGFVLPEESARLLGQEFTHQKRTLFKDELEGSPAARFERKGSDLFRPNTPERNLQYIRVMSGLIKKLTQLGGHVFYYADEKPLGTPKQTQADFSARQRGALKETLNRICTYAHENDSSVMVMIDQVNEKTRKSHVADSYAHIFSRSAAREEMRRLIEPPMHIDSELSSNIQFADWVAAAISRAIEYQLLEQSQFGWVSSHWYDIWRGSFTYESKLHLHFRSCDDIVHSNLFSKARPLYPIIDGQRLGASMSQETIRRLRGMTHRNP